jgi:hypothetical protein
VDTQQDRHVRPFAEWLHEQRNGHTHNELSDAFNDLIEAVQETGKVGSITFTVKIKPAGHGDHSTVVVSDDINVKLPKGERPEAIFFVDDDHNLQRHNPAQPKLPLKEIQGGKDAADGDASKGAQA